jgi:alkyldihydroxyacetonephosphate synthase
MRWWGWGEDGHAVPLSPAAESLLRDELGADPTVRKPPVAFDQVALPERALPTPVRERLAAALGTDGLRDDRETRVAHAVGRSYPDLVRIRAGDASSAPDAVAFPNSAELVAAVLGLCAEHRVAVVPFGGGTSVVGGVEPVRDGFAGVVSLDLGRMSASVEVDRTSLTARADAGLLGPELERRLGEEGVTLGHFPQSFEYSTLGGWVATRSAGQASTGYGRIDELVEAVRCVTPAGELGTKAVPASAAGPSLRELVVGSEGVLGVICDATLRVRPAPAARRYEGWSFASFAEGCDALRVMEQAGAAAHVNRLSDEHETRLTMALSGSGGTTEKLGRRYLRMRGHQGGCIAIVGFEGPEEELEDRRRVAAGLLRAGGGVSLGHRPGDAWYRSRFATPYLRDELLDRGVLVDTLETATPWSNLTSLHGAVREALTAALTGRGTQPLVMCHVSHLYPSGASLYFTFLARQEEDALAQWRAAKTAASEAIVAGGGTITHHHAIGRDHRQWLAAEDGELGIEVLRAAKERLDPAGIMNPGKLLPDRAVPPPG